MPPRDGTLKLDTEVLDDGARLGYLIDASAIEFEDADGKKTSWEQFLPLGEYQHPLFGTIDVTSEKVAEFVENVNSNVRGIQLDIDYEHKGSPKGGKAAGWIIEAEDRGDDGLWVNIEWTKEAAEEIEEGEWKYLSAEFDWEWTHPKSGEKFSNVIFGGALTNRPFIKDIAALNLQEFIDEKTLGEIFSVPDGQFSQEDARYREASDSLWRCANCSFYRAGEGTTGTCLVVEGEIEEDHISDHFKAIYNDRRAVLFGEGPDMGYHIFFRDIPQSKRKKLKPSDFAGKNRSFPIEKPEDVAAAASSLGRAGSDNYDTETLKKNIIRIAKRKGSAYTAKLPKKWKQEAGIKSSEREEVDGMDPKELRKALGLSEDASDDDVLARVKELAEDRNKVQEALGLSDADTGKVLAEVTRLKESDPQEDGKAKKFAEDYPEQAKQMEEQARQLREDRVEKKLDEWSRGEITLTDDKGESRRSSNALAPKVRETVKKFRMTLSDSIGEQFDAILDEVISAGTVDLSVRGRGGTPRGSTTEEGVELSDASTAFLEKVNEEQEMAEKAGNPLKFMDAVKRASRKHPQLAEEWRKARKSSREAANE